MLFRSIRQRLQQHSIDHAEQGYVRPDAHSQCDDGDEREAPMLYQQPGGKPKILKQTGNRHCQKYKAWNWFQGQVNSLAAV